MFASKLITFKRNLNVLLRKRLKIRKGPNMKITFTFLFSITRSAVYEMIHLNWEGVEFIQFLYCIIIYLSFLNCD